MAAVNISLQDKHKKDLFFKETFLLPNTYMKIVLCMLFFSLFNTDIQFIKKVGIKELYYCKSFTHQETSWVD